MHVDRFVRTELVVEREQPSAVDLTILLADWGLSTSSQEALWVIAYDSVNQVRSIEEIAKGGYHELNIAIAPILTSVLLSGTDRFKLAHNHPSGDISPTMADLNLTHIVMEAANLTGLYFEDHVIVGPSGQSYSMVENGLITPSAKLTAMARSKSHRRVPESAKR